MQQILIGISDSLLSVLQTGQISLNMQEILALVYDRIQFFQRLLASGAPPPTVMLALYSMIDQLGQRQSAVQPVSCRKGCAFCCKMNVDASPMEVALILAYAKHNHIPIDQDYLKAQAAIPKDQLAFTPTLSACVFLQKDNTCGIYPVRPIACRKYAVITPAERCNLEKYPKARLDVVIDPEIEILASALSNIQQGRVDSLPRLLLQHLNARP